MQVRLCKYRSRGCQESCTTKNFKFRFTIKSHKREHHWFRFDEYQPVDSALKFQEELDALSPEEQKAYLKEQEEFGEDVQGAVEGGIMRLGFVDGPKDPSKENL